MPMPIFPKPPRFGRRRRPDEAGAGGLPPHGEGVPVGAADDGDTIAEAGIVDEETAVALTRALVPVEAGQAGGDRPRRARRVVEGGKRLARWPGSTIGAARPMLERLVALLTDYVRAIQSTSGQVRDQVAGQLRALLRHMPAPDIGKVVGIVLRFVVIESARPYIAPPHRVRLRGATTHMSDRVHIYVDVRVVEIGPRDLLLLLRSVARRRLAWFPFLVFGLKDLRFAVGGEPDAPYLTITDAGTPEDWKEKLCAESPRPLRCCREGATERPLKLGEVIPFLTGQGVIGQEGPGAAGDG